LVSLFLVDLSSTVRVVLHVSLTPSHFLGSSIPSLVFLFLLFLINSLCLSLPSIFVCPLATSALPYDCCRRCSSALLLASLPFTQARLVSIYIYPHTLLLLFSSHSFTHIMYTHH
jgi:hypothetical protein